MEQIEETTFANLNMLERRDLQKLVISNLSCLGEELFLLAEEYGEWDDSNRRIDLLCLDKQKNLVVVEIKRTEDGGHMELQAIRYAAMVSSMTLDDAVTAHQGYLSKTGATQAAQSAILDFLEEDSTDEIKLTGDVRIVLASANFSSEITTSVMWLNKRDLDIACIRLKPYKIDGKVLIDATQIIPLPEAAEYEIKIKTQVQETRKVQTTREEALRRFWTQFIERSKEKTPLFSGRAPQKNNWLTVGAGKVGFWIEVSLKENRARAKYYIKGIDKDRERATKWSKAVFQELEKQRETIEKAFGGTLEWQPLPNKISCQICRDFDYNWLSGEQVWTEIQDRLIDAVICLESALRQPIENLHVQI
ncbi:MAG: DUF4268 domain-containing protein [Nitrospirae bacterium]|nr:DUF4268 domain-containing protein [Nitrospirota bacterium]